MNSKLATLFLIILISLATFAGCSRVQEVPVTQVTTNGF